ncbi:MAG TPA: ester cyclase [Gaiellaceae bacterium]|nr:ester cyclase [Gaiellaceae bacterium]
MTNEERVRAYWDRVWSRGEVEYAVEFYAPTFRQNGEDVDAAEFAEGARAWRARFEGFEATVDRLFTVDDGVVTQVTYRGRHVGDFTRVPATGKEIGATGLDVFLFAGGRCVEHLHEADHYTMFLQLGAPPTPA